jgi:hypothetical protein
VDFSEAHKDLDFLEKRCGVFEPVPLQCSYGVKADQRSVVRLYRALSRRINRTVVEKYELFFDSDESPEFDGEVFVHNSSRSMWKPHVTRQARKEIGPAETLLTAALKNSVEVVAESVSVDFDIVEIFDYNGR